MKFVEKLRHYFTIFACNLLWGPSLMLILYLISKKQLNKFNIIRKGLKVERREENLEDVSGQDLLWIEDSDRNRLYYSYLVSICGSVELEDVKEKVLTELVHAVDDNGNLSYPKLTRFLAWRKDKWFWKTDDNFFADRHIFGYHGNEITNEELLKRAVNEIVRVPFVHNKPGWRVAVIPWTDSVLEQSGGVMEYKTIEKTAILFQVHHCIADAFQVQKMVAISLADRLVDRNVSRAILEKHLNISLWAKSMGLIKVIFMYPFRVIMETLRREETPLTLVFLEQQVHYAWSPKIDLNLIKKIKLATKTNVQSVLISCLTEALKRHFVRCRINDDSNSLTLTLLTPIIEQNMTEQFTVQLENKLSLQLVKMTLDKSQRIETLQATSQELSFRNLYAKHLLHYWMLNVLMKCLPLNVINWLFDRIESSLMVTTVPVLADEVSIFDLPMDDVILLSPYRGRTGCSFTFVTYKNTLRVGATVNSGIVATLTELDQILNDFCDEVYKLANDAGITI